MIRIIIMGLKKLLSFLHNNPLRFKYFKGVKILIESIIPIINDVMLIESVIFIKQNKLKLIKNNIKKIKILLNKITNLSYNFSLS